MDNDDNTVKIDVKVIPKLEKLVEVSKLKQSGFHKCFFPVNTLVLCIKMKKMYLLSYSLLY